MSELERLSQFVAYIDDQLSRALAKIRASRVDRDESLRYAVNETLAWLNGPGQMEGPTAAEIAEYSIARFLEHQALPRVR